MRCAAVLLFLSLAAPASAQVISRPADPPIVTAENDAWYRSREPLIFAGEFYYPAGPTIFFNGNTMVRTGHYNGVPLYADTTIEPYSIVYVPIDRGLMQPYERVRRGDLAGTTGSRTPSFPVRNEPAPRDTPVAAASATSAPQPIGAVRPFTAEAGAVGTSGRSTTERGAVGTGGTIVGRSQPSRVTTARRPQNSDGVWFEFMGGKWVSAGPAIRMQPADFMEVGEYSGHPVYARGGLAEDRIYLPTGNGYLAPFKLKQ